MKKFITEKNGIKTEYEFVLSPELPEDKPISTPLTFAFIGKNLVLVEKNNGWWDVVGGKIEDGESWIEALKREAVEEAGISIDHIEVVGYLLAKNSDDSDFPKENILPVTISFVKKIVTNQLSGDVRKREALKKSEAKAVLNKRDDNGQLSEILEHIFDFYDSQDYDCEFEYLESEKGNFQDVPKTQAMVFVRNKDNDFIAVRDINEEHFSLPGGGCYMNESDEDCARREVFEEAQCEIKDFSTIGNVIVRVKKDEVVLSESRQVRCLAKAINIKEFKPDVNLEIEERRFVDLDFLEKRTRILNNDTGKSIVKDLKNKI